MFSTRLVKKTSSVPCSQFAHHLVTQISSLDQGGITTIPNFMEMRPEGIPSYMAEHAVPSISNRWQHHLGWNARQTDGRTCKCRSGDFDCDYVSRTPMSSLKRNSHPKHFIFADNVLWDSRLEGDPRCIEGVLIDLTLTKRRTCYNSNPRLVWTL
jgi:hypothetical protein